MEGTIRTEQPLEELLRRVRALEPELEIEELEPDALAALFARARNEPMLLAPAASPPGPGDEPEAEAEAEAESQPESQPEPEAEPEPRPAAVIAAEPVPRRRRVRARRRGVGRALHRAAYLMTLVAGVAVGLAAALPLEDVSGQCPPAGEGLIQCEMQKAWLPAAVLGLSCVLLAHLVFVALAVRLPDLVRRWRAGERPTRRTRRQRSAPFEADPVLLAASWGHRQGVD